MTAYMGLDAPLHFRTLRRLRSVHAPTTEEIERAYRSFGRSNGPISQLFRQDEFYRWLAARDARVIAAAEQRGAERALRDAAEELSSGEWLGVRSIDSKADYPYAIVSTVRWLNDRADRIANKEGNDE